MERQKEKKGYERLKMGIKKWMISEHFEAIYRNVSVCSVAKEKVFTRG